MTSLSPGRSTSAGSRVTKCSSSHSTIHMPSSAPMPCETKTQFWPACTPYFASSGTRIRSPLVRWSLVAIAEHLLLEPVDLRLDLAVEAVLVALLDGADDAFQQALGQHVVVQHVQVVVEDRDTVDVVGVPLLDHVVLAVVLDVERAAEV